ncbi:MAG: YqaA family protein [Planctomycetota bacterium]
MTNSTASVPAKPGLHRRLYNWVLHWADTPYALPALFVLSFAESSFFPIPPDILLLPLCLGQPTKALRYAFWCSVASVLGGIAGYWMGYGLWNVGLDQICYQYVPGFTEEKFMHVGELYEEWSYWIVFTAGFTIIPYKLFTISAGVFGISFIPFVIASLAGRSARFFLVAWLLRRYGQPIREFIEKRLGWMMILFCALLLGGFVLVKYVL